MNSARGIGAPSTVQEGTHAPVEITDGGAADVLVVTVIGTGEKIHVTLDDQGDGRFELPTTALAGEFLTITDPNNPGVSAVIEVVPASNA